jgi:hypothetical protein
MKWFLCLCALVAAAAITAASCGPQKAFCPTSNPDPTDLSCHANNDALGGMGGQNQGMCDGASEFICSNGMHVCKASDCPP